jgi:hypothetical protein
MTERSLDVAGGSLGLAGSKDNAETLSALRFRSGKSLSRRLKTATASGGAVHPW